MTLADDITSAQAACRRALDTEYLGLTEVVSSLPNTPDTCHSFLKSIRHNVRHTKDFELWNTAATKAGRGGIHAAERYLVLQACLASLPFVPLQPVHEDVKRLFCMTCRVVAAPGAGEDERFSHQNDAFAELAQIATLRRHHAGQLSFDIDTITYGTLAWWCLTIHPRDLFGLLRRLIIDVGLNRPVVMPHLCYWRPKQNYMLKKEQERSLLRIAKSLDLDLRIGGIVSWSWLYSRAVGASSPHLAWVRGFFTGQGAYLADLAPSRSSNGFLVGSKKRRDLYAQGIFRPCETVVLWRARDVLAWAESVGNRPIMDVSSAAPTDNAVQAASNDVQSRRPTLLDCGDFLERNTLLYAAIVLLAPAVLAAVVAATFGTVSLGLLAFVGTATLMWLCQYYFLQ